MNGESHTWWQMITKWVYLLNLYLRDVWGISFVVFFCVICIMDEYKSYTLYKMDDVGKPSQRRVLTWFSNQQNLFFRHLISWSVKIIIVVIKYWEWSWASRSTYYSAMSNVQIQYNMFNLFWWFLLHWVEVQYEMLSAYMDP